MFSRLSLFTLAITAWAFSVIPTMSSPSTLGKFAGRLLWFDFVMAPSLGASSLLLVHGKTLVARCLRLCFFRSWFLSKAFEHWSHLKGLSELGWLDFDSVRPDKGFFRDMRGAGEAEFVAGLVPE